MVEGSFDFAGLDGFACCVGAFAFAEEGVGGEWLVWGGSAVKGGFDFAELDGFAGCVGALAVSD